MDDLQSGSSAERSLEEFCGEKAASSECGIIIAKVEFDLFDSFITLFRASSEFNNNMVIQVFKNLQFAKSWLDSQ